MSEWRPGRGVGRGEESDTHTPKKKKEGGGEAKSQQVGRGFFKLHGAYFLFTFNLISLQAGRVVRGGRGGGRWAGAVGRAPVSRGGAGGQRPGPAPRSAPWGALSRGRGAPVGLLAPRPGVLGCLGHGALGCLGPQGFVAPVGLHAGVLLGLRGRLGPRPSAPWGCPLPQPAVAVRLLVPGRLEGFGGVAGGYGGLCWRCPPHPHTRHSHPTRGGEGGRRPGSHSWVPEVCAPAGSGEGGRFCLGLEIPPSRSRSPKRLII